MVCFGFLYGCISSVVVLCLKSVFVSVMACFFSF
jgi:hypothetical protein